MNPGEKLIYGDETCRINGACMEAYKTPGGGFLESAYQECLEMEPGRRGIPFEPLKLLTLNYQGS